MAVLYLLPVTFAGTLGDSFFPVTGSGKENLRDKIRNELYSNEGGTGYVK